MFVNPPQTPCGNSRNGDLHGQPQLDFLSVVREKEAIFCASQACTF
jgi:hypothetical protein